MKPERRWLKSAIAASQDFVTAMPWSRGARRKPATLKSGEATPKPRSIAAR